MLESLGLTSGALRPVQSPPPHGPWCLLGIRLPESGRRRSAQAQRRRAERRGRGCGRGRCCCCFSSSVSLTRGGAAPARLPAFEAMADEDLEALRKQRLAELQAKHGVRESDTFREGLPADPREGWLLTTPTSASPEGGSCLSSERSPAAPQEGGGRSLRPIYLIYLIYYLFYLFYVFITFLCLPSPPTIRRMDWWCAPAPPALPLIHSHAPNCGFAQPADARLWPVLRGSRPVF